MKHDIFSLKNKVCIVTGGYQGIGEIVAGYIADAGADIAIFDMNDAREVADRISNEYGVKAKAYCGERHKHLTTLLELELLVGKNVSVNSLDRKSVV